MSHHTSSNTYPRYPSQVKKVQVYNYNYKPSFIHECTKQSGINALTNGRKEKKKKEAGVDDEQNWDEGSILSPGKRRVERYYCLTRLFGAT